jgi:hypothetical protein
VDGGSAQCVPGGTRLAQLGAQLENAIANGVSPKSVRPAASRNWPPAGRPRWFAFKTTSTAVPRRVIPALAQDLADRNRLARDDAVVAGVAGRHIDDGAGGD